MQHHDAITGTHEFDVGLDYTHRMKAARDKAKQSVTDCRIINKDIILIDCGKFEDERFLKVYNPSLQAIKGLFIEVHPSRLEK